MILFFPSHGSYPRVFSRRNLIDVLWSSLPVEAQSKVYADKKATTLATTGNGVLVSCKDGTSYQGSMVIGADGAYSTVRQYVQQKSLEKKRRECIKITVKDEKPYLTTYNCFWVRFPVLENIKDGDAAETHGRDATTQFFVCEDSSIAAVYAKLDKPTRDPPRYTEADQQPGGGRGRELELGWPHGAGRRRCPQVHPVDGCRLQQRHHRRRGPVQPAQQGIFFFLLWWRRSIG